MQTFRPLDKRSPSRYCHCRHYGVNEIFALLLGGSTTNACQTDDDGRTIETQRHLGEQPRKIHGGPSWKSIRTGKRSGGCR